MTPNDPDWDWNKEYASLERKLIFWQYMCIAAWFILFVAHCLHYNGVIP